MGIIVWRRTSLPALQEKCAQPLPSSLRASEPGRMRNKRNLIPPHVEQGNWGAVTFGSRLDNKLQTKRNHWKEKHGAITTDRSVNYYSKRALLVSFNFQKIP